MGELSCVWGAGLHEGGRLPGGLTVAIERTATRAVVLSVFVWLFGPVVLMWMFSA